MSHTVSRVFGIDLGTSGSAIAFVDDLGHPQVVPNRDRQSRTPSIVRFDGPQVLVGTHARHGAASPGQVFERVKQRLGHTGFPDMLDQCPYTAPEITSLILRKVASDAEQMLGEPVRDVVLTCPAHFGVAEREATAHAGRLAGLNVRAILNEPTAAAITYGFEHPDDQVVVVFDLGGGGFEASVVEISDGLIRVVCTTGDDRLGGALWDEAIVVHLADEFQRLTRCVTSPMDDPVTLADLFAQAEVSKLRLSTQADASFQISHEGQERVLCLTRATFDELTGHLLGRCLELTRDLLRVARGMGCGAIDRMLLVGGSTRMPQIRRGLIEAFEVETVVLDGEDVVAKGAALYGFQDSLQRRVEEYLPETQDADGGFDARGVTPSALREALDRVEDTCGLRLSLPMREFVRTRIVNVLGKGLGLLACNEHGEDAAVYLLPRNSEVPVARTAEFGTDQHNQAAVEIRVVAGEQESADPFECQEVGLVVLELPPGLPAHSPIHVTFAIDRDGRLSVQALDVRGGGSIHVEFETDAILSEEQLAQRSERLSLLKVS